MPRRPVHDFAGTATGSGFAAYMARDEPAFHWILESVGGAIGGRWASHWPDHIEPASTPSHRGPAHSFIAGASVGAIAYTKLADWQAWLRTKADEWTTKQAHYEPGSALYFAWMVAAAFLRFLAGCLAGIVAGYLSHLVLDAETPAGMRFA